MSRLLSPIAYKACLYVGIVICLVALVVWGAGSRNAAVVLLIPAAVLIFAALVIDRRISPRGPRPIVWAYQPLQWAFTLPLAAGILIGLLTMADNSTALRLVGVGSLVLSFAVFTANLAMVGARRREPDDQA
jgi:hypothetical protein